METKAVRMYFVMRSWIYNIASHHEHAAYDLPLLVGSRPIMLELYHILQDIYKAEVNRRKCYALGDNSASSLSSGDGDAD